MRITIKKRSESKSKSRSRIRRKRLPVARSGDPATTRFGIATKSGTYFRHGPQCSPWFKMLGPRPQLLRCS